MAWVWSEKLMGYYCSECGNEYKVYIHLADWTRCPDCGVSMKGDSNGNC